MKLKIILLTGCLSLVGCVSNQKFDCPKIDGVRCQNMSEIDKLIDLGELNSNKKVIHSECKCKARYKTVYRLQTKIDGDPSLRSQEEISQIWVAGFESEGIYHHPSLLSIVLKPAQWNISN